MSKHENLEARQRAEHKREEKARMNKIWLWVGVIILVAILLFWIFDIGTFLGPNQ